MKLTPHQIAADILLSYIESIVQGDTSDLQDVSRKQREAVRSELEKMHLEIQEKAGLNK